MARSDGSVIPNVLASRYAGPELRHLWSPVGRIVAERMFWITVLEAQAALGLDVPPSVIDDYREVVDQVDLDSIRQRERTTRHDVKARIEEFCELAGHEHIHRGLTSRDVTENVEQMMVRSSLEHVRDMSVAWLARAGTLAGRHRDLVITGRSHNVAAQPTTFGKRVASAAQEMLLAVQGLETLIEGYPLRGLKGPVGTQQDLLDLFDGDRAKVDELERRVAASLGFEQIITSVGQIYPRSLDLSVVSSLALIAGGPASLATTMRLMAGHDLVNEGFRQGQVGSSAMPHKMNMRTSERINGLNVVLSGHLTMASGVAGHQWNEGDVSDSVVRRVMLPDAFFAIDGLLQASLTVLDEMVPFEGRMAAELDAELPFLTTTRVLTAAVRAGMGREEAHELIMRHTLEAAAARRSGVPIDIWGALADDGDLPLDRAAIEAAVGSPDSMSGRAGDQIDEVVAQVTKLVERHRAAAARSAAPLL